MSNHIPSRYATQVRWIEVRTMLISLAILIGLLVLTFGFPMGKSEAYNHLEANGTVVSHNNELHYYAEQPLSPDEWKAINTLKHQYIIFINQD